MNDNNKSSQDELLETPLRRTRKNNNSHRYHKPPKKRKRICLILLVLVLLIFGGVGVYALNIIGHAKATIDDTYSSANIKKMRDVSAILKKKKPFSILLLGTDAGLGRQDTGRTDTMIVATVNPKKNKVTMLSIPRDTLVHVSGSDLIYEKINAAYHEGGVPTTIKTVQKTLDVPIDYYLLVNMDGLVKTVDAVGGVTVTPPLTFNYEDAHVTKGKKVTLNGKQALAYSRMRHEDPKGDYGRQYRQRQVIEALLHKTLSISSLSNYQGILKSVKANIRTDLTYNDMMTIATNYRSTAGNIKSYTLQGENAMIDDLSYQVAPVSEKRKQANRLRHELGLADSTASFANPNNYGADVTSDYTTATSTTTGTATTGYY